MAANAPLSDGVERGSNALAAPTSSRALAAARRRLWRGLVGCVVAPGAMIAIHILLYVANFDRG